jgi:hypothetical protein
MDLYTVIHLIFLRIFVLLYSDHVCPVHTYLVIIEQNLSIIFYANMLSFQIIIFFLEGPFSSFFVLKLYSGVLRKLDNGAL